MLSLPTLASFLVPVWAPEVVASLSAVICHVCSPTAFNCSSVAARPFVAKSAEFTVVLDKPMMSFVVPPVTVTVPVLIVPAAPFIVTALVPPVVNVLFTPSTTEAPIVALPAVPSRVILLPPTPVVTLSFVITVLLPALSLTVTELDVVSVVFMPSVIVLPSTVDLLDLVPSTIVFSSTVDVFVLVPSLIT